MSRSVRVDCARIGRLRLASSIGAAAAIALMLAAADAPAKPAPTAVEGLSARLGALARSPALRSASIEAQARALSVSASGPGSLLRDGNRLLVEVRFDHGAAAAANDLRAAGAEVLDASRRYQAVTVAARPDQLRALLEVPGAVSADDLLAPRTAASCPAGEVVSEGDAQLGAAEARELAGVDGSGVTVGILSDSFNRDLSAKTHEAQDVASGDLPGSGSPCGYTTPVGVLDDSAATEATDEGRGMAQIVHDLAPGAAIDFATAFTGEPGFAENIRSLAAAGASVIVDDVGYFEEPFYQDGPIASAISEVTADGVAYFTAAGNDNLIEEPGGAEVASWEAPAFRDTSCPPALTAAALAEHCLDFNPGATSDPTFGITVEGGETLTVDVQWAEPWRAVHADIDAYLLDSLGVPLAAPKGGLVSSTDDNVGKNGTQKPVEVFSWENTSTEDKVVQLAINRCFGEVMAGGCNDEADPNALPRIKVILLQNGGGVSATEYPKSSGGDVVGPSIFGHAASASAISVGAVRYNDDSAPEPYSSRGPATHYFGPVAGASAASPLPVPEVLAKPDVVATDCGRTTFFFPNPKTPEIFRFCGTSAAAPHAAAVAALALQANPTLTPAEIAARLRATARPVGAFGPNAVGAGLVDAARMVEGVGLPPRVSVTERPPPLTRNRRPSFGFASSRPVSFTCSIDGGAPFACSSPFVPAQPLADGAHVFLVTGTDSRGRGASAPSVGFTVDATPPRTFFRIHPRRALRTPRGRVKAVFRFGSDDPAASFRCALDGARLAPCSARVARRVRPGHHRMRAVAVDVAGNVDATPAVFRFRVERARRRSAR